MYVLVAAAGARHRQGPACRHLPFALVLICGLMMYFTMKGAGGMSGNENHTGHGGEHDSAPKVDQAPDHEPADIGPE